VFSIFQTSFMLCRMAADAQRRSEDVLSVPRQPPAPLVEGAAESVPSDAQLRQFDLLQDGKVAVQLMAIGLCVRRDRPEKIPVRNKPTAPGRVGKDPLRQRRSAHAEIFFVR